jgi:hypothetical protein
MPKNIDNLLVSCRGSGLSHIAMSSSRLTRTMMALGEAAGTAAALCAEQKINFPSLDRRLLHSHIRMDKAIADIKSRYAFIGADWNGIIGKENEEELYEYLRFK